jgi:hyperosmotically inducible protein
MTADTQRNNSTDLNLTQQIRKSIIADKTLSTYAHNVKVVAVGGTVTLNGVVRTAEEKSKVSAIAAQVAGKDHVVDELEVAPSKS